MIFLIFILLFLILFSFIPFTFSALIYFSNSIFSYIGNIRSVLMLISFELVFSFILIIIFSLIFFFFFFCTYSVHFFFIILILFLCMLADSSRVPFDLIEGESELVSGFNTELSLLSFLLIFFGEYILLFFFILFFNFIININLFFILFLFIYSRALLVRLFFFHILFLF